MTPTEAKVKEILEGWNSYTNHAPVGELKYEDYIATPQAQKLIGELELVVLIELHLCPKCKGQKQIWNPLAETDTFVPKNIVCDVCSGTGRLSKSTQTT